MKIYVVMVEVTSERRTLFDAVWSKNVEIAGELRIEGAYTSRLNAELAMHRAKRLCEKHGRPQPITQITTTNLKNVTRVGGTSLREFLEHDFPSQSTAQYRAIAKENRRFLRSLQSNQSSLKSPPESNPPSEGVEKRSRHFSYLDPTDGSEPSKLTELDILRERKRRG